MNRRDFTRRAIGVGSGLPAVAALVQACRRAGERPAAEGGELGPIEDRLSLYNWSDYIAPDTVAGFEREFGVRVSYDTYESSEELLARLQAGASGYDLVFPSTYVVPALVQTGLAAPLSKQYLPNLANVAPLFRGLPHDPELAHTVPWLWGMTGIAWRTDRVAERPESWGVFQDPRLGGRMTMLDDMRDVLGTWLRFRGHSLNSVDPAELEAAKRDAILAKRNLRAFVSAPVKAQLIAGDVHLAQLWNGDLAQARREQPALDWVLPREGGTLWIDSMVVPAAARHKRAAHEFINYALRPGVGASIAAATGYGTPNQAAMGEGRLADPVPYPTGNELARLEIQNDLGRASERWDRIWTEVKSA
ncbi:MAG TPA: spermidine/putrescine ABC transporter substrate-binding protein [Gemmatimonadales bacterium]|nr:spermidine/putrescine ABC transporter substrate-binding protein [Gemmatimonadales bacterium]